MRDWHKRAVFYELLVPYFRDENGDGIGDFEGLTKSLDYLAELGVDCLWLAPFYDSPRRDGGYDIRDYYRVDERLGTRADVERFLAEADARGLRVIVDIVFNHTSIDHPWFQAARESPESETRDYYIWSDERVRPQGIANAMEVGRVWTWDEQAQQYYHHSFYPHQPDLNLANERLRGELEDILVHWLRLGVSGFRLDAVPYMVNPKGTQAFDRNPHDILGRLRACVERESPDAVLLGEADVPPEEYPIYFGNGDRLHLLLDFYICNYLFLALATQEATRLRTALEDLPDPPPDGAYANFLRNHDELHLKLLPPEDRGRTLEAIAPLERMHFFDRGSRRRLAQMLGGDGPRLRLALSLLVSLPGVPILYYGDEIGMGDDLIRDGRSAVRTPMQWSADEHGGFSDADAAKLIHPPISEGPFAYSRLNVAAQREEPNSLLAWVRQAIAARHDCPELGLCDARCLDPGDDRVLAHIARDGERASLAAHNLSADEVEVRLDVLAEDPPAWEELFADGPYEPAGHDALTLRPHGFRWFRRGDARPR